MGKMEETKNSEQICGAIVTLASPAFAFTLDTAGGLRIPNLVAALGVAPIALPSTGRAS